MFVLERHETECEALEILGLGIARRVVKVRRIEKLAKIVAERGREGRHARAGSDQVFRPSRGHHAAADDDCGLTAELEKNRQVAHGYPAPDRVARGASS